MRTIKEIRAMTGLSQRDFAVKFQIPERSLVNWELPEDNKNHRECPEYVKELLEKAVKDMMNEERQEYKYKKWTMQVDEGEEILLYDGERFMEDGFNELKKICGCRMFEFHGKMVYDDNIKYININDDVMNGIYGNNPSGEWNEDGTCYDWGLFLNDTYLRFRYYI